MAIATTLTLPVTINCSRASKYNASLASTFKGATLHSSLVSTWGAISTGQRSNAATGTTLLTTVCKMKTKKAMAKRYRVTGSGVIMRRRAGKQHLLVGKNTKRRKRLSKMVPVSRRDYRGICRGMPYLKVKRRHILRRLRRTNVIGSAAAQTSSNSSSPAEETSAAEAEAEAPPPSE